MARRLFAQLSVDENEYEKWLSNEDIGLIDYVYHEFAWLVNSGIELDFALIADTDDENIGARYCQYLIEWAMEHHEDGNIGYDNLPMSFGMFVGKYDKKKVSQ